MESEVNKVWVCAFTMISQVFNIDISAYRSPLGLQEPNVPDDVLVTVQKNLYALKELLDKNPHLFHSAPSDYTGARSATAAEQEAWKVCSIPMALKIVLNA